MAQKMQLTFSMSQINSAIMGCVILASVYSISASADSLWRFGYFWSPTASTYPASLIPWSGYTHIAQIAILPTTDCGLDDTTYKPETSRSNFVEAAHANGVKALIMLLQDRQLKAIGDCTSPAKIDAFVARLVGYIEMYGYDGIDVDWEAGVIPTQYQELIKRLRAAKPNMILTVDIAVHQRVYVAEVQDKIDRVNLMNYDLGRSNYNGTLITQTWHNAAIRSAGDNVNYKNAESNIYYMLSSKIAPGKINLGVPFYGYVVQGCASGGSVSDCQGGVTRPAEPFSADGVHLSQIQYNDLLSSVYIKGAISWDDVRKAPFISYKSANKSCIKFPCDADAFITYPDPRQMQEAVALIKEKNLGGIMTFALHQEYLSSQSGNARYPLTSAITQALNPEIPAPILK